MGKLIAIDGLDGSGKTTQCQLLCDELKAQGKNVRLISFPNYESVGSTFVKLYLDGKLGDHPDDTNPYAAATFYAVDRYFSYRTEWKDFYSEPDSVIIAARYTTANAVHQLSKLDRDEWDDYLGWLFDFEYSKLGLPKPDLVLFLEMKPEISQELIRRRNEETGSTGDIHEKDSEYLSACYKAALYSSDKMGWDRIQCYDGKEPLSIDEIQSKIMEKVVMLLDVAE